MEHDEVTDRVSTSYSGRHRGASKSDSRREESGNRWEQNELQNIAFQNETLDNLSGNFLEASNASHSQQSRLRAPQPQEDEEFGRRVREGNGCFFDSRVADKKNTEGDEARRWFETGRDSSQTKYLLDRAEESKNSSYHDISESSFAFGESEEPGTKLNTETGVATQGNFLSKSESIGTLMPSKPEVGGDDTEESAQLLCPPVRREEVSPITRRSANYASRRFPDVMMVERLIQLETSTAPPNDVWKQRKARYRDYAGFDGDETESMLKKTRNFGKLVTYIIVLLVLLVVSVAATVFPLLGFAGDTSSSDAGDGAIAADEKLIDEKHIDGKHFDENQVYDSTVGGEDKVKTLLRPVLSMYEESGALTDPSSPPSKALEWILDPSNSMANLNLEPAQVIIERFVMAVFYHAMSGDLWSTSSSNPYNFMDRDSICNWNNGGASSSQGVLCEEGSVAKLTFQETKIRGSLPSELVFLTNLRRLDLRRSPNKSGKLNHLKSSIQDEDHDESEIGSTRSGPLPKELGMLSNLQDLVLEINGITGTIPTEFGNLSNLIRLGVKETNVTGTIPSELGMCTSLQHLNLDHNSLVGSLPKELSNLLQLDMMILSSNDLTGAIPTEFGLLKNITRLNVKDNKITGTLPTELGKCKGLRYLLFDRNHLIGTLPVEYGRYLSQLEEIALESNELTGTIPLEYGFLSKLSYLHLNDNHFTGSIPRELGSCTSLASVRLDHNDFVGRLPYGFGHLRQLLSLTVESNRITGLIPTEFGMLTTLHTLNIRDNNFMGTLPSEFGTCTSLSRLWLDQNELVGPIPSELGGLSHLQQLVLATNSFTGTIPTEFGVLEKLHELHLGENRFTGPLPTELGRCTALTHLLLDKNDFGGRLPSEIGRLRFLQDLWVNENHFVGTVPYEFRGLSSLASVRMNKNNFSGNSMDSAFCHHGIPWTDFWADCLSDGTVGDSPQQPPLLTCTCCTTCCNLEVCNDNKNQSN